MGSVKFGRVATLSLVFALVAFVSSVQAAPKAPKDQDVFEDWAVTCPPEAEGQPCRLAQVQVAEDKKTPVVQIVLGKIGSQGEEGAIAWIPLGYYIPTGVAIVVDGKAQIPLITQKCMPNGCQVAGQITAAQFSEMKNAKEMFLAMKEEPNGKTLLVNLSNKGLTKGLDALGIGK